METNKKTSYKYCIVPKCKNTTIKTPNKLFFNVPREANARQKWCNVMKRDEIVNKKLAVNSRLYCCEDHFNIHEDMENYFQYRMMGQVNIVKLKPGVIPHLFECQRLVPSTSIIRTGALKRRRIELVQEAILEATKDVEIPGTSSQEESLIEPLTAPEVINPKVDKCAQTNLKLQKPYVRSKATQDGPLNFDPRTAQIGVLEHSQIDESNCNSHNIANSIKSEPTETEEFGNSFDAHDYHDYDEQNANLNLAKENNANLEHDNIEDTENLSYGNITLEQIQIKNELLKRTLMLKEHNEKLKVLKVKHNNELLKSDLLKLQLQNLANKQSADNLENNNVDYQQESGVAQRKLTPTPHLKRKKFTRTSSKSINVVQATPESFATQLPLREDSTSTNENDYTRMKISSLKNHERDKTLNSDINKKNSIQSEQSVEFGSTLVVSECDHHQESDLNLEKEYNRNLKFGNISLEQIQKENKLLKRKLMLHKQKGKMKLSNLQRENELQRTSVFKATT